MRWEGAIEIIKFLLSDDFWPPGQFQLSRHELKVRVKL